jgi:LEA14-like dessication related protein
MKKYFVFFSLTLLTACALFHGHLKDPEINLQNVEVRDMTLNDANIFFDFSIQNPNDVALAVDRVNYQVEFNGKFFSEGEYDHQIKVAPNGMVKVKLPIRVKYADLIQSLQDFLQDRAIQYKLKGSVKLGMLSVPFDKAGKFEIAGSEKE